MTTALQFAKLGIISMAALYRERAPLERRARTGNYDWKLALILETSLSGDRRTAAACAMRREPPVEIVGVAEVVARVMVGALEVQ